MNQILNPPFNLFGWSLAIFLLYVLLQSIVTVAYALGGGAINPFIGLMSWFAVSAAIGYTLEKRHRPPRQVMYLLQGFACLYMALAAFAVTVQRAPAMDFITIAKLLGVLVAMFLSGLGGFALALALHHKFHSHPGKEAS